MKRNKRARIQSFPMVWQCTSSTNSSTGSRLVPCFCWSMMLWVCYLCKSTCQRCPSNMLTLEWHLYIFFAALQSGKLWDYILSTYAMPHHTHKSVEVPGILRCWRPTSGWAHRPNSKLEYSSSEEFRWVSTWSLI